MGFQQDKASHEMIFWCMDRRRRCPLPTMTIGWLKRHALLKIQALGLKITKVGAAAAAAVLKSKSFFLSAKLRLCSWLVIPSATWAAFTRHPTASNACAQKYLPGISNTSGRHFKKMAQKRNPFCGGLREFRTLGMYILYNGGSAHLSWEILRRLSVVQLSRGWVGGIFKALPHCTLSSSPSSSSSKPSSSSSSSSSSSPPSSSPSPPGPSSSSSSHQGEWEEYSGHSHTALYLLLLKPSPTNTLPYQICP